MRTLCHRHHRIGLRRNMAHGKWPGKAVKACVTAASDGSALQQTRASWAVKTIIHIKGAGHQTPPSIICLLK
jgi:hypothetical protein